MTLRHTVSKTSGKHYYFTCGNRRITKEQYDAFHRYLSEHRIMPDLHIFKLEHKHVAEWVFDLPA